MRTIMKIRIIIMIVTGLLNWGCASHSISHHPATTELGRPIDFTKYDQVIEGKTRESQVVALFGDPSRVIEKRDGKILQYSHFLTQSSGNLASPGGTMGTSSHSMLMFKINNGIVIKKAKMVASQPMAIKPETVTITPGQDKE